MNVDYRKFAFFNYDSFISPDDKFRLGDVVIKQYEGGGKEVGVILQSHGSGEYRTDMFGNCCTSEIRIATKEEIKKYREDILVD
jgi:hypothetical protein